MMFFKFSILLFLLLMGYFSTIYSICGPDALPFKFSAYKNAEHIIECFKPACFEENSTVNFYRSFTDNSVGQTMVVKEGDFHIFISECYLLSGSYACPIETKQMIDENKNYTHQAICCKNEHVNYTHENDVIVGLGQEIAGGNVYYKGKLFGFDYISDLTKIFYEDKEIKYEVRTRRINCANQYFETESELIPKTSFRKALAAPNVPCGGGGGCNAPPPIQPPQSFQSGQNPTYLYPDGQDVVIYRPPVQQSLSSYYPSSSAGSAGYCGASAAACPNLFCFSGDTELLLVDGTTKRMDELEIGDWVKTKDTQFKVRYSMVTTWLHRLPQEKAIFIKITLSNGKSLKLTSQHLIYKSECGDDRQLPKTAVPADDVSIGDCLYTPDKLNTNFVQTRVEDIELVEETGVYAPLTDYGDIVVNGVLASCHSVTNKRVLHDMFSRMLRRLNNAVRNIFGENSSYNEVDLPVSSQSIMELMEAVLPYRRFSTDGFTNLLKN